MLKSVERLPESQAHDMGEHLNVHGKIKPPTGWDGAPMDPVEDIRHYLHLSAFPCAKCNGPVVVGWMGTRHDELSKETNIRPVGAACIACGFMPQTMIEPSVGHHFRPVEWKSVIKEQAKPPDDDDADPLVVELSRDTDSPS